jgi:hypothetical protein
MPFDYDSSDVPENMDGFDYPKPGEYHFMVNSAVMDDKGQLVVDAEILAGNPAGQEGKVHKEWFSAPKADQDPEKRMATLKRQLAFFVAVGLTSEEELLSAKKAGKRVSIDESLAVGRQFVGRLSAHEYQGKTTNKLGYDIWNVKSPKAAGIPLNAAMLAQNGDKQAPSGGGDDPFAEAF